MRYDEAEQVVAALARAGDWQTERMMSLLAMKIDNFGNGPMKLMEPLMVRLAGELRHAAAIPIILTKLRVESGF